MPEWLLSCHIQMLPRLQAEESLRQVNVLAVASPYAKQYERTRAMGKWRRMASGDRETHGFHLSEMSPAQEQVALAQLGMTIKTVPRPN